MKTPSVKNLVTTFRITPTQAGLIKRLCNATDAPKELRSIVSAECPETAAYARQCYNDPFDGNYGWRVTVALHAIDCILGTHGVEALEDGKWEYCNTGDSYGTTLVYHRDADAIRIGSWGDIAERFPCND